MSKYVKITFKTSSRGQVLFVVQVMSDMSKQDCIYRVSQKKKRNMFDIL